LSSSNSLKRAGSSSSSSSKVAAPSYPFRPKCMMRNVVSTLQEINNEKAKHFFRIRTLGVEYSQNLSSCDSRRGRRGHRVAAQAPLSSSSCGPWGYRPPMSPQFVRHVFDCAYEHVGSGCCGPPVGIWACSG
jgi:hypothetical protein